MEFKIPQINTTYTENEYQYDSFTLSINKGGFRKGEVILLIGENGPGKTTFINMLLNNSGLTTLTKSHKPQNPYDKLSSYEITVRELLVKKKLLQNTTFVTIIINALGVNLLYDTQICNLSKTFHHYLPW